MLSYVYDKFIIFDFKMNIINKELTYIKNNNNVLINKIIDTDFIKLCSLKNEDIDFKNMNNISKYIFWAYCIYFQRLTDIQGKYFKKLVWN